jgi:hypothetical protein
VEDVDERERRRRDADLGRYIRYVRVVLPTVTDCMTACPRIVVIMPQLPSPNDVPLDDPLSSPPPPSPAGTPELGPPELAEPELLPSPDEPLVSIPLEPPLLDPLGPLELDCNPPELPSVDGLAVGLPLAQ